MTNEQLVRLRIRNVMKMALVEVLDKYPQLEPISLLNECKELLALEVESMLAEFRH